MSSSIPPITALTFSDVDIQDINGIFLQVTQGLNEPPEVRGVDVTVPGLDGQVPRPRRRDKLTIVLAGFVRGVGADNAAARADYRANVDQARSLFNPVGDPGVLSLLAEDGTTRTNTARPVSVIWNEVVPSEFAYISVELLSVVPSWTTETVGS